MYCVISFFSIYFFIVHPFQLSKLNEIHMLTVRHMAPKLTIFLVIRMSEVTVYTNLSIDLQRMSRKYIILIKKISLDTGKEYLSQRIHDCWYL